MQAVLLAAATQTQWILYYVVALHTTFFVVVFVALYAAAWLFGRGAGTKASWKEKAVAIFIYAGLIALVWEVIS